MKTYNILFLFTILICISGCALLSVDSYYSPNNSQINTEKELCIDYRPAPAYSKHFGPDNVAIIYHESDFKLTIRVMQHRIYDLLFGPWIFSVIPNFGIFGNLDCNQYVEKNVIVIQLEASHAVPFDWDPVNCKLSTLDGTIFSPSTVSARPYGTYVLFFDINEKRISSFNFEFGKMIIRQVEFTPPVIHFKKSNGVIYSILNP